VGKALSHRVLQNLACKRLYANYDIVIAEFTPFHRKVAFDIIALNRLRGETRIIECKASRADFLADRKWETYLPYCTHLAFLGPATAFLKEELPSEIGVIRPRWEKRRTWQGPEEKLGWYYERGCKRLHDVAAEERMAVLEGMLGQYMKCVWRCPPPRESCLKMRLEEAKRI